MNNLTHTRTVNGGTPELITTRAALDEINAGVMDRAVKRTIRSMSAARSSANIEYRDGRKVVIRPATAEEIAAYAEARQKTTANGRRIVTVKGKRYIVSAVIPGRPKTPGAKSWVPEAYVTYWAERSGTIFGPTRHATASSKPGTVGAGIWAGAI